MNALAIIELALAIFGGITLVYLGFFVIIVIHDTRWWAKHEEEVAGESGVKEGDIENAEGNT